MDSDLTFKCFGNIEDEAAEKIYRDNKKMMDKIWKRIQKQVRKNPLKRYYKISMDDYTFKQMKLIKRLFVDYLRFGFSKYPPLTDENLYNITNGNYTVSVSANGTFTATKVPVTEFYLTWFND